MDPDVPSLQAVFAHVVFFVDFADYRFSEADQAKPSHLPGLEEFLREEEICAIERCLRGRDSGQ